MNPNNVNQNQPPQQPQTQNQAPQPTSGVVPPANPPQVSQAGGQATPQTPPTTPASMPQDTGSPASPPPPRNPTTTPTASIVTPEKKGGFLKKFIILLVVLAILGGGAAAAFFFVNNNDRPSDDVVEETGIEEVTEEETEADVEPEPIKVLEEEIDTASQSINHNNPTYAFTLDYLTSWDFECVNCDELAEDQDQEWKVLEMKTFDFEVDENEKIVQGARLEIYAWPEGTFVDADFTSGSFNNIEGLLNLDPSAPTQGFVYTNEDVGLDIELRWKSTTAKDRADQELQTILGTFRVI